jgi:uracil-DNA glycosylase
MIDTNINLISETKKKIINLLKDSGWADKLRIFLNGHEMDVILEKLLKESEEGRHFTPTLKDVFNAFIKCPFDDVKVVLIGQDPYPQLGVADGIAFSCSKTGKVQPSLKYIFKAIEETVHQEFPTHQDPDLSRWAKQGVLSLNTAFTCQIDKVGSHYEIWSEFLFMVIDALNFNKEGIPFVLMGKQATALSNYINPSHHILKISHPASAAYAKANLWDCHDCFNKVNNILISQQKSPIIW